MPQCSVGLGQCGVDPYSAYGTITHETPSHLLPGPSTQSYREGSRPGCDLRCSGGGGAAEQHSHGGGLCDEPWASKSRLSTSASTTLRTGTSPRGGMSIGESSQLPSHTLFQLPRNMTLGRRIGT